MNSVISLISQLEAKQIISSSNVEFAHLWVKLDPSITIEQIIVFLGSFYFTDRGHVTIDQNMLDDFISNADIKISIQLVECLNGSTLVGKPEEFKPFILYNQLLYQQKSFFQEKELAVWLNDRSNSVIGLTPDEYTRIQNLDTTEIDTLQKEAIQKSFTQPILFLTGGPGTGKTYTVHQILKAHREIFGKNYAIQIAAPTGKAAQRINDSMISDENLDIKATTIHQLLGAGDILSGFRFNNNNPIPADLIIIDEASMMDLSLWSSLIDAISNKTKLLVVGDPFQLASVESGAVLNDIYELKNDARFNSTKLANCIIELKKRHRFSDKSGIQLFAEAVNRMEVDNAIQVLENSENEDLEWVKQDSASLRRILDKYSIETTPHNKNSKIDQYRLLSALRNGRLGCNNLNTEIEGEIKKQIGLPQSTKWFDNRMIMINKNDYRLGLQNGEIGIFDEESSTVQFESDKKISVDLLSNYESGYCITIHKSQGSEYDHVAIILPEHENSILTKELLYTAVTRARKSVLVFGNKKILTHCISNKTKRKSGLAKQLDSLLG